MSNVLDSEAIRRPPIKPENFGDILVVDDTPANLRLLVGLLNRNGYHARPAISGRLAISGALAVPPALILLDIIMPDLDGYEVCMQLKADERTRDIPVIFVSALDEAVDKARAFSVGAADYIPKPFHPLEAIARVEHQLRLCEAQHHLQQRNQQLQQFSQNLKELHRLSTTNYASERELWADSLQAGCTMLGFTTGIVSHITDAQYRIEAVDTDRDDLVVGQTAPLKDTYCSAVVAQAATLACGRVAAEPRLRDRPVYQTFGFESYLSTPIWVNDAIYGTLSFAASEARPQDFAAHECEIIELMAESLGNFITAQQAQQQRQRAQQETELLLSVTQAIAAAPDFEGALQAALSQVCKASGWSYGEVWLPAPDQQHLRAGAAWYCHEQLSPTAAQTAAEFYAAGRDLQFARAEGLPGRVWQRGEPEYCTGEILERVLEREVEASFRPQASLAVPIVAPPTGQDESFQAGQVLAVLVFCQFEVTLSEIAAEDERVVALMTAIATQLGTVLQHKRAEAELNALFAAMDDLVIVYDRHGRCLKFATHTPELLVRPVAENVNQYLHDLLPADVADCHVAALDRTLETQQPQSFDYQLALNGQTRWFSGKMSPLSAETVIFVTRDMTNMQQAQAALRKSEARFRAIFESAAIGIGLTDTQGNVADANPALSKFLGYDTATLSHLAFADYTYPDDIAADRQQFQQVVSGELASYQMEKRYLRADGQVVWGRLTLCPVWQDDQLAFLVGMVEDIDERKQAEQALRDSEAEMRAIFAAMTDLVLIRDRHGCCLKVAPTSAETLVRPAAEMVGRTLHETLPPPLADRLLQYIQTVIETRKSTQIEYSVPLGESECWLDARISPFGSDTVILVARDISERKLIEHKLRANEAELRSVFEAMNDIVLAVAPEPRTVQVMPTRHSQDNPAGHAAIEATCTQFFPPTENAEFWSAVAAALSQQQTLTLEYQLDLADQMQWFNASISPLPNGTALWVARDISDRVRIEQALQALANELEQRVVERTSQLRAANEILRTEIGDRIRVQDKLAASTEQLQAVLDAVPGFVSWMNFALEQDRSPRYLGVNRLLAESFQRQPEGFMNQPVGFISAGSEFSDFINEFFRSPAQSASTSAQLFVKSQPRHYLIVAQKYNANRTAVSIGIDITARVNAEQRLQQAYQRLQLLSELTLKIRQSLDIDDILHTATQEVLHLLAADRVLIVAQTSANAGQIVQEAVLPEWASLRASNTDLTEIAAEWQACQAGQPLAIADVTDITLPVAKRAFLATWQVQAKLVVPIFVHAALWGKLTIHQCRTARQWHSEEIELLQQCADQIGIALSQAQLLDNLEVLVAERTTELQLTNQHLQQEISERQRAEVALRHSEEQLRRAVDSNTYGMVVYTPTGDVRFMNRAAETILAGAVASVQAERFALPLQAATACEVVIARPPGDPGIVEVQTVAIRWEGEAALLASLMDITERKAIEQMKDEFLSVASHELRTPLTSIRGSLGLLATGRLGQLSEKGSRMLTIAVNNADRLSRLIDDILDLERMKSGRVQIVKQHCQAVELMTQAIDAMQSMADQAAVRLQRRDPSPAADIPLWADPDQILQTLTNLISNSIKFSPPDSCIRLAAEQRDREILLAVSDEGRGIPADKLESIFARFQQVDASDSREKGGTGLGLAICREIVKRHGGRIWVESEVGRGSQFYIALPDDRPRESA